MPTFTPPTTDGLLVGNPKDPSWLYYKHLGAWETGLTVWKDQAGVWHQSIYPYQGGAVDTVHDWDGSTYSAPDEGLATAQVVYLGGHVHQVTDAEAAELIAAGYPVGGHVTAEEAKWVNYAISSSDNLDWKGGDGFASQAINNETVIYVFSDNTIGTVGGDGFYLTGAVSRNAGVVEQSGVITTQILPGGVQPGFPHPTPGHWWWPLDVTLDGSGSAALNNVIVSALHLGPGGWFGEYLGSELLSLNVFGGVASTVTVPGLDWTVKSIYNDTDFHYIVGAEHRETSDAEALLILGTRRQFDSQTFSLIARAPIGNLTNTGTWTYWDGTGWHANQSELARVVDVHNSPIEGDTTITKSGSTWVLAALSVASPELRLYKSASPQGPWTFYHTENTDQPPTAGAAPPAETQYAYYQPKFHEHLSPAPHQLVASYNRNTFHVTPNAAPPITAYHVSTFCPQFVYVPAPED